MRATIKDVAAYACVSPTTVSRVVNQKGYVSEAVRRRVLEAIEKLDYTPNLMAMSLSQKKMHTIGVIFRIFAIPFSTRCSMLPASWRSGTTIA